MKKRILIAGIGVVILITLFMTFRLRNKQDPGVLPVSGNVEVTEVNIAFKIPGRVVALLTDEGRTVRINEKIAALDSAEYESQVNLNRAVLRNAEATLDKASKDYERADVLFKNGAISSQQMDAAKTANDVTFSQVQQAAAALRTSEVKLKDTVIYSPISGVVLRKNVEAGETVSAGTPVYTIGDLDNPWIKVYVREAKLGLVKLGQKAEIRTDSYPGKIYEGTVTYISSEAEFTPKNVQTQEERVKLVYGVKVSVKNVNDELKPGMPADVKILLK
jgi:HlyD family secretion protein